MTVSLPITDIILHCLLENAKHLALKLRRRDHESSVEEGNVMAISDRPFLCVFRKARVPKFENATHILLKCVIFQFDPRNIDATQLCMPIVKEDGE